MITEVDEALCQALGRALPKGTVVRLDPPKPTWQTEKPSSAIDLFLFGVADDKRGAMSGWEEVRSADGLVQARRQPPRRYLLSYLVTARAPKIFEEHSLLDTALRALTDGQALPAECLPAPLAELGLPVLVDLDPAGPGELWSSLGMPARAAFVLSVSAPHRRPADAELAPPADTIDLRSNSMDASGGAVGARGGGAPSSVAAEKRWKRVRLGVTVAAPVPAPDAKR